MKNLTEKINPICIAWILFLLITMIALFKKPELLLSAHFLTFFTIILIISVFYKPLFVLISRGTLTIKWGDREISITEIEKNIDAQNNELESKLSDLASEIDNIKKSIETKDKEPSVVSDKQENEPYIILDIMKDFGLSTKTEANLLYNLSETKFDWRNLDTLSKRTNLPKIEIETIVQARPDLFKRSISKTGNVIYKLNDLPKIKLNKMSSDITKKSS